MGKIVKEMAVGELAKVGELSETPSLTVPVRKQLSPFTTANCVLDLAI